jgi:hypothetical protein
MSKKARGLFDEQERLEKLSKKQDPLERLSAHIDFEFFRRPLQEFLDKDVDRSKGGRPAYDYVLMFKILILQRYYNLSDDTIEYAILDRLSFMRFLGLGINDPVPDACPGTSGMIRSVISPGTEAMPKIRRCPNIAAVIQSAAITPISCGPGTRDARSTSCSVIAVFIVAPFHSQPSPCVVARQRAYRYPFASQIATDAHRWLTINARNSAAVK